MTRITRTAWPVAAFALRSSMEIAVAVLLIMILLPVALGAVGSAGSIGR